MAVSLIRAIVFGDAEDAALVRQCGQATGENMNTHMNPLNPAASVPAWQIERWFNTATPLSLEGLRSRVVVFHAFQMLCPGCVSHSLPQMEKLHQSFAKHGVSVIGLHSVFEHHQAMQPHALEAFLHEYRITHPIGVDAASASGPIPRTMRDYQLRGTPSLIVYDKAGAVRLHHFGRVDDLALGVLIGQLLSESAPENAVIGGAEPKDAVSTDGCDDQSCPR